MNGRPAVGRRRPGPSVTLVDATSDGIAPGLLLALAAVLQIQVDRDLWPRWGLRASIAALPRGARPPAASWAIWIVDVVQGASGKHLDACGVPYALVDVEGRWTVTASHELLEMLGDPGRRTFRTAPSIDPAAGGRPVHYLVEIADPCEDEPYLINGVQVSDFVTPAFYGGRGPFDLLGRLSRPLEVLLGGSLSWIDPYDGHWWQKLPNGEIVRGNLASSAPNATADRDAAFAGVS